MMTGKGNTNKVIVVAGGQQRTISSSQSEGPRPLSLILRLATPSETQHGGKAHREIKEGNLVKEGCK